MGDADQPIVDDVARRAREEMLEATANLRALLEDLRGDEEFEEPPRVVRSRGSAPSR
jgi:hypothetical protein